jgi:UDP-2,3-diacylglucosamine pyrophosphatase LpxH
MRRVAYFISDLHLGADPELEGFHSDEPYSEFLAKISVEHKGHAVELVLLGDIFDLWQVVPLEDKTQPTADRIELDLHTSGEAAKLARAAENHPQILTALRRFLESDPAGRKVFFVYGNHDHSLVDPSLQASLRQKILGERTADLERQLIFGTCYDNPDLRVYAEHGNQYDPNNYYGNFYLLAECPGYFFVRLFWNRLEPLGSGIDSLYPDKWHVTFRWMIEQKRWNLLTPALKFFRQYRRDKRVPEYIDVPGVPFFASFAAHLPPSFEAYPELLFKERLPPAGNIFSENPAVEIRYRALYSTDVGFRNAMDQFFRETFGTIPVITPPIAGQPSPPLAPFLFGRKDRYMAAVEEMFANHDNPKHPYFRARPLEPERYDYVILGHTHTKSQRAIDGQHGKIYFNTGSWVTRTTASGQSVKLLTYVMLQREDSGPVDAMWTDWQG